MSAEEERDVLQLLAEVRERRAKIVASRSSSRRSAS
jgi:hypothetical protein